MSNTDVAICGGGLVGTLLALLLAKQRWSVTIIDPQTSLPHHDGRVLAINRRSLELLKSVDVHVCGEPIREVRAYEEHSPWSLDFSANTLKQGEDLGHMVAYEDLRSALMIAREQSSIQCMATAVTSAHVDERRALLE